MKEFVCVKDSTGDIVFYGGYGNVGEELVLKNNEKYTLTLDKNRLSGDVEVIIYKNDFECRRKVFLSGKTACLSFGVGVGDDIKIAIYKA